MTNFRQTFAGALMLIMLASGPLGCGGGSQAKPAATTPAQAGDATGAPPPKDGTAAGDAPKATREQCMQVIGHTIDLALATPGLKEEQRQQIEEQRNPDDELLQECQREMTQKAFDCYMAAKDMQAMQACEGQ